MAHIPRQQLSRFVQLVQHIVKGRFWHDFRGVVCTKIEEQFADFSARKTRVVQHIYFSPYNTFNASRTTAFNAESGHENRGGRTTFIAVLFAVISSLL